VSEPASSAPRRPIRPETYLLFFLGFALIVFVIHVPYARLPYFWDEMGQFVPAALDIANSGAWVPHSTTPNVHPPAVMAYLALVWHVAGYSIPVTRAAMLLIASFGVLFTFLLAIELCRPLSGAPAFLAPLLLVVSPLFYTQAMMAQLDMPAMVCTIWALLLFLQRRYAIAAAVCTLLVLVKETGLVAPALFLVWLAVREKRIREAAYFIAPFATLGIWLIILKHATGHWLGNSGFTHYNVFYSLEPVRAVSALIRRIYYLFFAEFRWIGTIAIVFAWRKARIYATSEWIVVALFFCAHVLLVSLFGGATLERYLMPVLPLVYIATAAAWSLYPLFWRRISVLALQAGLIGSLFWNSPYPVPLENNLAMADFVQVQKTAAEFLDDHMPGRTIASAWPFTQALTDPRFGYVSRPFRTVETTDFHVANVTAIDPSKVDVLVVYARTWEPKWSVLRSQVVIEYLRRYYDYEPQITPADIRQRLGFIPVARWQQRGQWIDIYVKLGRSNRPQKRVREREYYRRSPDEISSLLGLVLLSRNRGLEPAPGEGETKAALFAERGSAASGRR